MILIGFTCTGTFQLWLNCAQNYAMEVAGWADPSAMQSHYSLGTMLALIVTSILTRKVKDVNFILVYPAICFVMLIVVLMFPSQAICRVGSFVIGWAGAGGLLQIVTSVCNMLFLNQRYSYCTSNVRIIFVQLYSINSCRIHDT